MKKLLLCATLALAALSANADGIYAGGSVGFWHQSTSESSTNQLTILPEIGYGINDKFSVGAEFGYDYTHLCGRKISVNLFEFNPYVRYTFFRSDNNFVNLFVDGTVGVGAGWASFEDDNSDTAVTYQIGLRPGLSLNFNEHFSFVTHIGMLGYKGADDNARLAGYKSEGGLMLNGNALTFGFYYTF